jgi:hypothetical protein
LSCTVSSVSAIGLSPMMVGLSVRVLTLIVYRVMM